jgi:hypothetical protein
MPNTRLPDARPARRHDSITSASSYPELLTREIVLRQRMRILLSAKDREVLSTWRRRVLAVYALLAATITGYVALTPGTRTIAQGVSKDAQARAETCVQYTGSLSDAADRQMPSQVANQVANQDTRAPASCASTERPASGRGVSTGQPQAN